VIAGASDGTGAAFARELAALGISTVLISRRLAALDALAGELSRDHGIETRTMALDLTDIDAGARILAATADLDVGLYVSNAGADGGAAWFLENPADRWLKLINLNVRTIVETMHGLAQGMSVRGRGGVIVMLSNAALGGHPGFSMYSATKAFGMTFVEAMWSELGAVGIDVLGVLAPAIDTPTLRRGVDGTSFDLSQALDAGAVASAALAHLPDGPLLCPAIGPDALNMERIQRERRERVLMMAEWTRSQLKPV
jgi:short-subunit dehydrogenase